MSDMIHFKKWSLVRGHIQIDVNLERFGKRFETAQRWLGEQVLEDCRAFMPLSTGSLQDRSHTEDGGRLVVFPGPYARYLYMGVAMVDRKTGKGPRKIPTGPNEYVLRFREGAKLKPTGQPLIFSNPEATAFWFDAAKARNLPHWINGVENMIRTGRP